MRIVIAPDSFKECLSAAEACRVIEAGVRRAAPDAEIVAVPMADGGEGTVDALVAATGGRCVEAMARGPLGRPVVARYGAMSEGGTAVIETAAVAGLALVPVSERNPGLTTTYGVGELIRDAMRRGVRRIIIGLGGSGTNDGGAGLAQALGFALSDKHGRELALGGLALRDLARIERRNVPEELADTEIVAACDVDNPLCGPNGASMVYGPQKGATPEQARELDAALRHFAAIVERDLGVSVLDIPGAGAAGGLGAGLMAFAGGVLRPGVDLIAEAAGLREALEGADLVFTGEGTLDGQSVHGKTPVGVARIAKAFGARVVALAGALGDEYQAVFETGIDEVRAIAPPTMTQTESMARARELLADAAETATREFIAQPQPHEARA